MPIETGLRNKVVIVTGAAAGIGKATAHRFAQEGCRVASWDVKDADAEEGGVFQKVDVTNGASVQAAVEDVFTRWGAIHVLVNNAGILRDGQLAKYKDGALAALMSDEQFDSVIGVNLRGVFTCTRAPAKTICQYGDVVSFTIIGIVGLSAAKLGPASAATDTTALAQSNFFNILGSSREATRHAQWRLDLALNWALAATAA